MCLLVHVKLEVVGVRYVLPPPGRQLCRQDTVKTAHTEVVQWNLHYSRHHLSQYLFPYSKGSLTRGVSCAFPVGVVLCNQTFEDNMATFSDLSCWQGRLTRGLIL